MATIQDLLLDLKKSMCFTTMDMSILIGVSRGTLQKWEQGVQPSPNKEPLLLEAIERIKAAKHHFPVPLSVNQYQRKQYLLDALNDRLPKLSKQGASARR